MQINKIQNNYQASFGIKYANKEAWNKDVLKAFENSNLYKSINEKYPDAKARYIKISGEDSIANSEIIHTLIMDLELTKNKLFRWCMSSHTENVPDKVLMKELPDMSLKEIEKDSKEKLTPLTIIEIKTKQNPIKAFFQKIFS